MLSTLRFIIDSFKNDIIKDILIEEFKYLDSLNSDAWAVSIHNSNKLRIHFGPFIIMAVESQNIWLSLDSSEYENNVSLINSTNAWLVDTDDYPKYVQYGLTSQNGYLNNQVTESNWNTIKYFHFAFLNKIGENKYKLKNIRTKKNHTIELNLYLKLLLSDEVPIPSYIDVTALQNQDPSSTANIPEMKNYHYESTEKLSTVTVRIGQQVFRQNLLLRYKSCILCGIENCLLLRASHIKPWHKSTDIEKLNPANGLLLCANHDALFDSGLIAISENDTVLISNRISDNDRLNLGSMVAQCKLNDETKTFIEWHRNNIYSA